MKSKKKNQQENRPKIALLLGGGGARAAYQVGVLKAIAEIVPRGTKNPFPIICGTSAGSINASALASNSMHFHLGVKKIVNVWSNFKLNYVFHSETRYLIQRILSWAWSHIGFGNHTLGPSSLLDTCPLRDLLSRHIDFESIDRSIEKGDLHAYCVTACSFTTGESVSFFHGHDSIPEWQRNRRRGHRERIGVDHLMASSAIPVVFPSVLIGNQYFGDGSMRQTSPISAALHLGAEKVLIIGLRTEKKTKKDDLPAPQQQTLGNISGYILDTLFLNSLYSDIERLERINDTLSMIPTAQTNRLRKVESLMIIPSKDVATIAIEYFDELPRGFRAALFLLGMKKSNSRRFISYLMFIKSFCKKLIEIGYNDAMQQRQEIEAFLDIQSK